MTDFSMLNALRKYKSSKRSSFHTPGHKTNWEELKDFSQLLQYDLTELEDTGSLFDGKGLTAEAEGAATAFFGTKGTFFSSGGCTLPIQAMFRLALPQGGKLISGRTVHRSAINAMALLDINPVWLLPDRSAGEHFSGRITAESLQKAIEENPDAGAVYITSPDYFGVISDISALSQICKNFSLPLLVDNAHGSHLRWTKPVLHPIDQGADLCADSAHKTLPVLTGGAFLHVLDETYLPHVRSALSLFASTSPSYPVMTSLDLCRQWLEKTGGKDFLCLQEKVKEIKNIFLHLGLHIPKGTTDPLRLSAHCPNAEKLAGHFRVWGIEPEYAGGEHIILIPSPFNTEEDFDKLRNALISYESFNKKHENKKTPVTPSLPQQVLTPREALLSLTENLSVSSALGRIAAEAPCLCPPGIPLISPGELIDERVVENMLFEEIENIKVVI